MEAGECVDMAGIRRRRRRRQEAQAAAERRSWRDVAQAQWRLSRWTMADGGWRMGMRGLCGLRRGRGGPQQVEWGSG
jgi:hypothetical protein